LELSLIGASVCKIPPCIHIKSDKPPPRESVLRNDWAQIYLLYTAYRLNLVLTQNSKSENAQLDFVVLGAVL